LKLPSPGRIPQWVWWAASIGVMIWLSRKQRAGIVLVDGEVQGIAVGETWSGYSDAGQVTVDDQGQTRLMWWR
jgi:hypothetical protein